MQVLFDLELYLLRHGDAGRRTAIVAGPDSSDLPLTIAGREEIAVLARSLKQLNLKFDVIISSPLKRNSNCKDNCQSFGYGKENINL